MRNFEATFYCVVLTGFVLKLFHLPMNTYVILMGLLLLLGFYLYAAVKKKKKRHKIIMGVSTCLVFLELLFNLKFYPFRLTVLIITAISCVAVLVILLWQKKFFYINSVTWFFAILLSASFKFISNSEKYYVWNIRYNYQAETDYMSWDKYGWFLYQDGKREEALKACDNAEKILSDGRDENYHQLVRTHREKILAGNWEEFYEAAPKNP